MVNDYDKQKHIFLILPFNTSLVFGDYGYEILSNMIYSIVEGDDSTIMDTFTTIEEEMRLDGLSNDVISEEVTKLWDNASDQYHNISVYISDHMREMASTIPVDFIDSGDDTVVVLEMIEDFDQ